MLIRQVLVLRRAHLGHNQVLSGVELQLVHLDLDCGGMGLLRIPWARGSSGHVGLVPGIMTLDTGRELRD